ncbi:phosphate transport system regulatory protein PhoU [Carbonactinospora thermoautotrophica]|uniref:phosphate signaling complex protein PhoU n=1 Tax=Carbonactinospora thermoautotrophica TaxID=1469144 RepID=UPI00226D641E|nr:phosphate signaling complex protein PhoU [Carbonactinospora thermoautotrophica]MCX9192167.1 phosphate transport system regulatory protein PhoU [Carbonactinospora thermoautotrophica]
MSETRRRFHEELDQLEGDLLAMGRAATGLLARAAQALGSGDADLADSVIQADDDIDERYVAIDRRALDLLALQTPVATDLRLVIAVLHINLHLERVGDTAVNTATVVKATQGMPTRRAIVDRLLEMAAVVGEMVRVALAAFARRDLDLALRLPEMDQPVDRINRDMYPEVAACGGDPRLLEWALRMMAVSRQLERAGDHAVDIAEQVAFLLTGEFQEFTDASHPVRLPDGRTE